MVRRIWWPQDWVVTDGMGEVGPRSYKASDGKWYCTCHDEAMIVKPSGRRCRIRQREAQRRYLQKKRRGKGFVGVVKTGQKGTSPSPQDPNKADMHRRAIRRLVIGKYGPNCVCCGESEEIFLTIDHIGGGGNAHRKELGINGGERFYAWLVREDFPSGYQTLCFNCNAGRSRNGGMCPHTSPGG